MPRMNPQWRLSEVVIYDQVDFAVVHKNAAASSAWCELSGFIFATSVPA